MKRALWISSFIGCVALILAHVVAQAQIPLTGAGRGAPGGAGLGLQTNLSAFWSFENTGWTDDTGNGNTLTPANTPTAVVGQVGNAVNFVGASSQSLNVANNAGLQVGGGSFSIQVWVNLGSNNASNGEILSKDDGGFANKEWFIGTRFNGSANVISWALYNVGTTNTACDTTQTPDSNWHHLVVTWDGTTMKAYLDNSSAFTATPPSIGVNTTSSIFVGKDGDSGGFSTIKVDQTGIWKGRVLSAGDVSLLWNGGAGLTYAAMH